MTDCTATLQLVLPGDDHIETGVMQCAGKEAGHDGRHESPEGYAWIATDGGTEPPATASRPWDRRVAPHGGFVRGIPVGGYRPRPEPTGT